MEKQNEDALLWMSTVIWEYFVGQVSWELSKWVSHGIVIP